MATILIIDDCRARRDWARFVLESTRFRVIEARDGLAGLQRAVEDAPDAILIEADLLGLDGFEVCARLASASDTEAIPALLCSESWAGSGRVERARACGARGRLTLPMSAGPLQCRVEVALVGSPLRPAPAASPGSLARSTIS